MDRFELMPESLLLDWHVYSRKREIFLSAPLRSIFVTMDKITNNKKTEINKKTQYYTKLWNLSKFKKKTRKFFPLSIFVMIILTKGALSILLYLLTSKCHI